MSLFSKIRYLKIQIAETEKLLNMVIDHPLMSINMKQRLKILKEELDSIPQELFEPVIQMLFSGDAVSGSEGIKSTFVSKITPPIQGLVKTQLAIKKYGKVGSRGRTRKKANNELYLTALPRGSFGIELTRIEGSDEDLFDLVDSSEAMKDVIYLIKNTSESDESFQSIIETTPKRNLSNLKKLLQEISNEKSMLKMDCGEVHIELTSEQVDVAAKRVSYAIEDEYELVIDGIFRGMLLDSNRFEILDHNGNSISGYISNELEEEALIEYDRLFLNKNCSIYLKAYNIKYAAQNEKIEYELLEIKEK
ncbi:hypothetical protein CRN76_10695 [Chryseobacterium indologenes]|uniref:hypothetical protein n=1 Tax=Chryseobacterium indologenes TaxID=253 RepID=UPI000BFE5182|nr:hypothetical protein [Chryseobacterium indologenes]ATN05831.1 hypothetical protein CRN76_10695 [Chryseobacterium indologenes]AYY85410.1 hypothetical protein EGX91_13045 [Chryseobacterium indologenes]QIX82306.1 hypothetical protein FOB56_14120 [Chryseobacterium indologenes]UDQ56099.1 hypothetical protein LJF28_10585 [Chryseobacterium indologenes]